MFNRTTERLLMNESDFSKSSLRNPVLKNCWLQQPTTALVREMYWWLEAEQFSCLCQSNSTCCYTRSCNTSSVTAFPTMLLFFSSPRAGMGGRVVGGDCSSLQPLSGIYWKCSEAKQCREKKTPGQPPKNQGPRQPEWNERKKTLEVCSAKRLWCTTSPVGNSLKLPLKFCFFERF